MTGSETYQWQVIFVVIRIHKGRAKDLVQVCHTDHLPAFLPYRCQSRQQDAYEKRNDAYDHKEFDQRKT
mgnify:CR=1 FL=1